MTRALLKNSLDTAHAGRRGFFLDDPEAAERRDSARIRDMGAAAELAGVDGAIRGFYLIHGHFLRVFLPETPLDAGSSGSLFLHHYRTDSGLRRDRLIDIGFHAIERLARDFFRIGEVETGALLGDIRSRLMHPVAELFAEPREQKMRRGMKSRHFGAMIRQPAFEFAGARRTGQILMPLERFPESAFVYRNISLFRYLDRHFQRKPIRGKENERVVPGYAPICQTTRSFSFPRMGRSEE